MQSPRTRAAYRPPRIWQAVWAAVVLKTLLPLAVLHSPAEYLSSLPFAAFLSALLLSGALALRPGGYRVALLILNLTISVVLLANTLHARAFGRFISIQVAWDAHGVSAGILPVAVPLLRWPDLFFFIDLPVLATLSLVGRSRWRPRRRLGTFAFVLTASLAGSIALATTLRGGMVGDTRNVVSRVSVLGAHAMEVRELFFTGNRALTSDELHRAATWFRQNVAFQAPSADNAHLGGSLAGRNVIAIHFESLETVLIGRELFGAEITPNLNRLLPESYFASNMVEQVRDGNSSDAELLFAASVFPLQKGAAFLRYPANSYVSLPTLLAERGYTSWAIHGDDPQFWNRSQVFPQLGFTRYVTEDDFLDRRQVGIGVVDESLFDQALVELEKLPSPWLFHIETITSHTPFELPTDLYTLVLPEDLDKDTAGYLQSIAYTDHEFGLFYHRLESEGMMDDAVVIIYGDHQGVSRGPSALPPNGGRVPLIIHAPGLEQREISKPAGQVDMMPTLAWLLGVAPDRYETSVMGRNLFGTASGSGILSAGQLLPGTDSPEHLLTGHLVADDVIRSDYWGRP